MHRRYLLPPGQAIHHRNRPSQPVSRRTPFWWRFKDSHPWIYAITRRYWILYGSARHPVSAYYRNRKWRMRPQVGDRVQDCRYQIHTVTAVDPQDPDTLTLDDGSSCSWMHCCDPVPSDYQK